MTRHCSVCSSTRHDARRHRRPNPDTEQLGAAYGRALAKVGAASGAGNARGERRWERSAKTIEGYIDDERRPVPHLFASYRDRFGNVRHYPIRYDLMSEDRYRLSEDAAHTARARRRREGDRLDRLATADRETERHSAAHKRKLGYDPAAAKAARERRTKEVRISPTATKKAYAAAQAKAVREGKTLVVRARAGGNLVAQNDFARRFGNQGTRD